MTIIYVVVEHFSYYEDSTTTLIKAYTDKEKAEENISEFNQRPTLEQKVQQYIYENPLTIPKRNPPVFDQVKKPVFDKEKKYDLDYHAAYKLELHEYKNAKREFQRTILQDYEKSFKMKLDTLRNDYTRKVRKELTNLPNLRDKHTTQYIETIELE